MGCAALLWVTALTNIAYIFSLSQERASQVKTFIYVKVTKVPLFISYHGRQGGLPIDIADFQVSIPNLEYHSQNWTWKDLFVAIKKDCKQAIIPKVIETNLLYYYKIIIFLCLAKVYTQATVCKRQLSSISPSSLDWIPANNCSHYLHMYCRLLKRNLVWKRVIKIHNSASKAQKSTVTFSCISIHETSFAFIFVQHRQLQGSEKDISHLLGFTKVCRQNCRL